MPKRATVSTLLLVPLLLAAFALTFLGDRQPDRGTGWLSQGRPAAAAAPYEIPGVEIESHDHVPPMVDSNGNLYRVTEDIKANGNRPQVMKSTDGGVTWVEQDAAHRPTSGDTEGGWALQDGPTIWFAWQSANVKLTRFNTSDHPTNPDTYQIQTEHVTSMVHPGPQYTSLAKNRDGSLWVAFGSTPSDGPRSAVVKRAADGGYGSPITIDAGIATTAPRLVKGSNDRTYVFYKDHTHDRIYFRALSAEGTLSAPTRVDTGGTSTTETALTNVVKYDDGAEVLAVMFAAPDGMLRSVEVRNGVVGPEQAVSSSPVTIDPGATTNLAAVAHLAVVGSTVVAVWSDAADGNVYSDQRLDGGQWGGDVLTVSTGAGNASNVQYVYANGFRRNGSRATLGLTYDVGPTVDDDSNIFYRQIVVTGLPDAGPGPRWSRAGSRSGGYPHATQVTVRDAAGAATPLTLRFQVKPVVMIGRTRTGPALFTLRGDLRPAVATTIVLQRKRGGDWARVDRDKSSRSGTVAFAGQRPGTYRLNVPAAKDRVAARSPSMTVGR